MKILRVFFLCLIINPINLFSQYYSNEDSVNIAAQLNSIYQANFIVNVILNVDSASFNYNFCEGRVSDPYNTLSNCLVFLASQIIGSQSFGNSLIGIYRENQVVWSSNETVKPLYLSFGQVYGIIDVNDDGMNDILSQWIDKRDNYNQKYLWIFSWNGNSGICINEGENYSKISTHGYSDFEIVDIEGDGIWEIVGFGADEEFNFIPEIYQWNGSKYSPSNININTMDYFFPRNNFLADINCNVIKANDSTFRFNYYISNNILSKQQINEFYLEKNSENLINLIEPSGWNLSIYDNLIHWYDNNYYSARGIYITKNVIKSGEESIFSYESVSLPSIQNFYLRGYNFPNLDPANGDSIYTDIFNNSFSGATIGANDLPYPFITSNFLDTILAYNQLSSEFGWIKNQTTADKYESLFNAAKTLLQQNNNNAARATLQTVLQEVDIDSTDNLTSEAYALFRYNTEYLIEKIPLQPQLALKIINPAMSLVNPGAFTMEIKGSGFSSTSVVYFNNNARATTFVSDSTLNAAILASDVSAAGNFPVWVSDNSLNSDTLFYKVVSTLPQPVRPVLECVTNNGDGTYTAFFGYKNENSVSVYIPVGSKNKFTPNPQDRGQTRVFKPGRQIRVYTVNFNGSNLVWTLNGRTSTASKNSAACQ